MPSPMHSALPVPVLARLPEQDGVGPDWLSGRTLMAARTAASIGADRVLDVGCKSGWMLRHLSAHTGARTLVGVDRDAPRLVAPAAGERFRVAAGDVLGLPVRSQSVDLVTFCDVLEHLPDLPAAVAELARVLAPGGSFLFDTINRTPWAWFTAVFGLEQVLRMVPRGTHDWRLFIRPAELDRLRRACQGKVARLEARLGGGV